MAEGKVAILTAGGLAPCLSAAVGGLIERYAAIRPEMPVIGYLDGYRGLLVGQKVEATAAVRAAAHVLYAHGGSPLGNSRVKFTNVADCVKQGLVREGQDPLRVAAEQLSADGVTILHTVGGDDTNTAAAELAAHLGREGRGLTVVGLPKTVDNDVTPIRQSLGAWTAAEQGALFFANVVNESSANPAMLLVHEVMGRNCGWLTAATARAYRERLAARRFLPAFNLTPAQRDVDAVYLPEMPFDLDAEAARLRKRLESKGCVNIFVSEGAGAETIVAALEAEGKSVRRDAFGHVKLDSVNVGQWFADRLGPAIGAAKTLVQKSGYFARSAAANADDLRLIGGMVDLAVECGLNGRSGVIGHDEEQGGRLRAIEFERIKGGKPFDVTTGWFTELLAAIGQPARGGA